MLYYFLLVSKLRYFYFGGIYLFKLVFKKGRGTRGQIANTCWIIKKAREFQKNVYFCFIDYAKAFVWITINCGKF